jgi:hypothetical protein
MITTIGSFSVLASTCYNSTKSLYRYRLKLRKHLQLPKTTAELIKSNEVKEIFKDPDTVIQFLNDEFPESVRIAKIIINKEKHSYEELIRIILSEQEANKKVHRQETTSIRDYLSKSNKEIERLELKIADCKNKLLEIKNFHQEIITFQEELNLLTKAQEGLSRTYKNSEPIKLRDDITLRITEICDQIKRVCIESSPEIII